VIIGKAARLLIYLKNNPPRKAMKMVEVIPWKNGGYFIKINGLVLRDARKRTRTWGSYKAAEKAAMKIQKGDENA